MTNPLDVIDKCEPSDLEALVRLAQLTWLESLSSGLSDRDIAEALKERNRDHFVRAMSRDQIWLYKSNSEIKGFIQFGASRIKEASDDVEIRKLYVATTSQGEGIGRALMAFSLDSQGLKQRDCYLDVWSQNERALKLYLSMGFHVIEERIFQGEFGPAETPDYLMLRPASRI